MHRREFIGKAILGGAVVSLAKALPVWAQSEAVEMPAWFTLETAAFVAEVGANAARRHPPHTAGYNGIWSLRPRDLPGNIFFEEESGGLAGMNLEHYFDGATDLRPYEVLFDPRVSPMTLECPRAGVAVLRQPPTQAFGVESVTRFAAVEPHYIDYSFRCTPRRDFFPHGYLGVFWACYLHDPADPAIRFLGYRTPDQTEPEWITTTGGLYYGRGISDIAPAAKNPDLPGYVVYTRAAWEWAEPCFYGVIREHLFLLMLDTDLPLGFYAGNNPGSWNPWDFQLLIPQPRVGDAYGLRARLCVAPFEGTEQVEREMHQWKRLCQVRAGKSE